MMPPNPPPGWKLGMNESAMADPMAYARRLYGVCSFYPTPEQWGEKNGRELRVVLAALIAEDEHPGVVLHFTDGQATGWYRP